jgi:hypothetical protein
MFMSDPRIKVHVCHLDPPAGCFCRIPIIDDDKIGADVSHMRDFKLGKNALCSINLQVPDNGMRSMVPSDALINCKYREARMAQCPEDTKDRDRWMGNCDDCSHFEEYQSSMMIKSGLTYRICGILN